MIEMAYEQVLRDRVDNLDSRIHALEGELSQARKDLAEGQELQTYLRTTQADFEGHQQHRRTALRVVGDSRLRTRTLQSYVDRMGENLNGNRARAVSQSVQDTLRATDLRVQHLSDVVDDLERSLSNTCTYQSEMQDQLRRLLSQEP
ncbi:hypothetical protein KIM372_06290 [Bombiscardovia nodaiensis]|uniref:Uncharacterized protein n=1 Tax=Bombiscardovia nodaiensis TaxID=2932181 RepID=A0ABN6S976_9BIFI|nr:hypothetical protein KIM372_06290 [Bombiscardovia nodaiensis]